MTRTVFLIIAGIAVGALIAKQEKQKIAVDPTDLIIEKSKQTMRQASEVSARADKQVAESVSKMKLAIEVLEEEKHMLVEQVKTMENEIVAIKSEPAAVQPFNVLAILPDSTR